MSFCLIIIMHHDHCGKAQKQPQKKKKNIAQDSVNTAIHTQHTNVANKGYLYMEGTAAEKIVMKYYLLSRRQHIISSG